MRKLGKQILLIVIIALLCFVIVGNSTANEIDAKDVKWNISDGLNQKDDAKVLIYKDGDYSFRIVDENDNNLVDMKKGFTKGDDGIYVYEWSDEHSAQSHDYGTSLLSITYGEYVKINDNTYWAEASFTKSIAGTHDEIEKELSNANKSKLIEYLTYFNEHNNVEIVDL